MNELNAIAIELTGSDWETALSELNCETRCQVIDAAAAYESETDPLNKEITLAAIEAYFLLA